MTEHDKPREWYLTNHMLYDNEFAVSDKPWHEGSIHVREVRPGEITLTRDELKRAFDRAEQKWLSAPLDDTFDPELWANLIAAELFPEGQLSNE